MPITKEELIEELKVSLRSFEEANRKLFATVMRAKNMTDDTSYADRTAELLAAAAHHLSEHASDYHHPGQHELIAAIDAHLSLHHPVTQAVSAVVHHDNATQPVVAAPNPGEAVIPQLSVVPPNPFAGGVPQREAPSPTPPATTSFEQAKDMLRTAFKSSGLPSELLALVDRVSEEDLKKIRIDDKPVYLTSTDGVGKLPDLQSQGVQPSEQEKLHQANLERQELLANLVGRNSLFVQLLNKDLIFGGKGQIKIDSTIFKAYREDVRRITSEALFRWPSGVYVNQDTKARQLFVNSDQFALVADGLPSEQAPILVLDYVKGKGFQPIDSFDGAEIKLILMKVSMALQAIAHMQELQEKKKGPTEQ